MWLLFAILSAVFAGLTSILAKIGISGADSNVCTALRTTVVAIFSWVMVLITGAGFEGINGRTLLYLLLSGTCTGASWIFYYRALSIGDVNVVVPIDKSSTILTILLCFLLFGDEISLVKLLALIILGVGIFLMIERKPSDAANGRRYILYAILAAVFASLTTVFGKLGVSGIDADTGSAIRTMAALGFAWILIGISGKAHEVTKIGKKNALFILLSGICTGASWLCYYRALADETSVASAVVAIDKLSVVMTVAFAGILLKEKLSRRSFAGFILMCGGIFLMLA